MVKPRVDSHAGYAEVPLSQLQTNIMSLEDNARLQRKNANGADGAEETPESDDPGIETRGGAAATAGRTGKFLGTARDGDVVMSQGSARVREDADGRVNLALGRAYHRRGTCRGRRAGQLALLDESALYLSVGGARREGGRDLVLARVLRDGGDLRAHVSPLCRHDSRARRYCGFGGRGWKGRTSALAPQTPAGPSVQRSS